MFLSVVAPAYNEEAVIEEFYRRLKTVLDGLHDIKYEILIVLDRSSDRSLEIIKKLAKVDPKLKTLYLSSRFGHQMALIAGIDHALGDVIIMMDSDLQHPPELIPKMLAEFKNGSDIVYTVRDDSDGFGFLKRKSSKTFYKLLNFLSDVEILESASDFRLISKKVAEVFRTQIRERNQFIRGLISWVGFNSTHILFKTEKRASGNSKYSIKRLFQFALHGILSFSKKPLLAAIIVGSFMALFGFFLAIFTVVMYFTERESFPTGWATLATMIPLFSGVQLIFLGVLGQYIGAIFDEVKARPHYIVDQYINIDPQSSYSQK